MSMRPQASLRLMAVATLALGLIAALPDLAHGASKDAQRADALKVANQTLDRLYKLQPAAKEQIRKAAGYAAFSNFGMKILIAGGGKGEGVAFSNHSKQLTYMKMVELQAGLGFGVKKFRLVWVFDNQAAFDKFVNSGWELGTQATAAAQVNGQGAWAAGALSISPGVWLYQMTDDGLALELTAKGTRYYKDAELN